MKQIKGLNTLRAFAVFFVFIAHFGVWFDEASPSGNFIKYAIIPDGSFAVNMFFVLSGFLITGILLRAKGAGLTESRFTIIKNFFIRRALRIFPIYYLLLFLLFFINYPDIHRYFGYFVSYTSNILLYRTNEWNSFSHTWTLAIEEQFYLIWPWLMIFVNNKYIKYVLFSAVLIGAVSSYITVDIYGHRLPFLVYNSFDAFGIGGLYAWAQLNEKRRKNFERSIKIVVIPAIAIYFFWRLGFIYRYQAPYQSLYKTINSVISVWFIILIVNNKSATLNKYFLENPFLNYIGTISYGIYLYHIPYITFLYPKVFLLFKWISDAHPKLRFLQDTHYTYWIHLLLVIIIAGISFRFIEKPLLKLKDYFNYNGRKKRETAPGAEIQ